ncbi:MAG: 3-oxoacid CoA-transferase subunit B [Dehalococcoidia bacterium]|jgi:3-oxoacid CoA-transferase subunit B|nr:3-oxoacid CoA-transferase subunit B [Dehalococcoidia bacterium]MDP7240385.1 3-oxoacid CoA-transferase subunit B [Dehalococcoidia bacterium]
MNQGLSRELIAVRIAREFKDGMYVNLGFGMPTLVCSFLPPDQDIFLHSEQGILGYGGILMDESKWDVDLINASGQPVSLVPGACFCDLATSFGMIRGGHLDVSVLGAYQVSEKGDLANWKRGDQVVGGIGGAMDLAIGAKRVIVAMEHATNKGEPKIVHQCSFPLTAGGVVKTIVTNLAFIDVTPSGLVLREVASGVTAEEVQALTEPKLIVSNELREMEL